MGNPEITFNDTPLEVPNEELPHERMRGRFLLRTLIDIEMLRRELVWESAARPRDFLSEPEAYREDNVNIIVISGYAPSTRYDLEGVLDVVRRYDNGATLI